MNNPKATLEAVAPTPKFLKPAVNDDKAPLSPLAPCILANTLSIPENTVPRVIALSRFDIVFINDINPTKAPAVPKPPNADPIFSTANTTLLATSNTPLSASLTPADVKPFVIFSLRVFHLPAKLSM